MSKKYDYTSAKKMIQMRSDLIVSASMGMGEDWFWTATPVYENNKFEINLDDEPEIAGIRGSSWATPTLYLLYKDGQEEMIPCYKGESDSEKPEWFSLGVLSNRAQEWVEQVKRPKLN